MITPYPAHFTVTQSFTTDDIRLYKRDSQRAMKALRAFRLAREYADIRGSLTRIFSRSTSNAAVSSLLVTGITPLVGIYV